MKDERRPQAASASISRGDGITVEQAARELQRRKLPRDRRGAGRAQAIADRTFYVSRAALEAIAGEAGE